LPKTGEPTVSVVLLAAPEESRGVGQIEELGPKFQNGPFRNSDVFESGKIGVHRPRDAGLFCLAHAGGSGKIAEQSRTWPT
jgi:hypothetical protein